MRREGTPIPVLLRRKPMKRYRTQLARLLCLALLLVSFTAVTAAAQEPADLDCYPDQSGIGAAYAQAVERMTEQGVLQGYDDGGFHPADTLTREQGAKIITYLLLGAKDAQALTCDAAPYTDVAASRWSAPCIAWCTERHILDGYGGGLFGPADTLTGQQFAKMLLCACGLGDGYVGADWAAKVSAAANGFGLFTSDAAMDSAQPLQRQQAALMAVNAQNAAGRGLETPEVEVTPSGDGWTVTDSSGDILLPDAP